MFSLKVNEVYVHLSPTEPPHLCVAAGAAGAGDHSSGTDWAQSPGAVNGAAIGTITFAAVALASSFQGSVAGCGTSTSGVQDASTAGAGSAALVNSLGGGAISFAACSSFSAY